MELTFTTLINCPATVTTHQLAEHVINVKRTLSTTIGVTLYIVWTSASLYDSDDDGERDGRGDKDDAAAQTNEPKNHRPMRRRPLCG